MDCVIISNYWHFEFEKSSSRYLSIANMLASSDHNVEVITSSFYHATKSQRMVTDSELKQYAFKSTLIHEPGYKKNIDPRRVLSHKVFAKNVVSYLKNRAKPDVIYLFVPPLDLASVVMKFAKQNGIKVVIDVLDLWPEAYKMVLPFSKITGVLLEPMRIQAEKIYNSADDIIAVSQTYVDRAKMNKKDSRGLAVYIGADGDVFDQYRINSKYSQEDGIFRIAYIGMLGTSYNLICIIDAIKQLPEELQKKTKFVVMGDGPRRIEFEEYAKKQQIMYVFTGKLPYEKMVEMLSGCDIAVNPINGKSAASIINKVADYAAAGLPVINTQNSAEYINLLNEYSCGFSFDETEISRLSDAIRDLLENDMLRIAMGGRSRRMFDEKFNRKESYPNILERIESLSSGEDR